MAESQFTTEELASEEWRPILGNEGRYEVSNLGRIKSLRYRGNGDEAFLTQGIGKSGYLRVTIGYPQRSRYVHAIVAEAFHGPRPISPDGVRIDVNHKDGIKPNCRESNLEWMTHVENTDHARRTGLLATGARSARYTHPEATARGSKHGSKTHPERVAVGTRNGGARLSETGVLGIRAALSTGCFQHLIAAEFGVSQATISRIACGTHWKSVP